MQPACYVRPSKMTESKSMGRLQGKRALILGASSPDNMGQHIARRYMAEGARVLVAGRKEAVLAQFAAEHGCDYATCDLTDQQSVEDLAQAACDRLGGIDI